MVLSSYYGFLGLFCNNPIKQEKDSSKSHTVIYLNIITIIFEVVLNAFSNEVVFQSERKEWTHFLIALSSF